MKLLRHSLITLFAAVLIISCSDYDEFPDRDNTQEVDAFYLHYNEQVKEKLESDIASLKKALQASELSNEDKVVKEAELKELMERNEKPEYFTFATIDDLPEDIKWVTNFEEPEIGSENAKKGGIMHTTFAQFPSTLRVLGDGSNNSFRGEQSDNIEMSLVSVHPNTGELIPGLASEWAVMDDKKTVFYHIDDKATYSDGVAVETGDIFMSFYLSLGPYVNSPYRKDYFSTQFTNITYYDEKTFSITLAKAKPLIPAAAAVGPAPRHYYKEVGPDFINRYNWRPRPTTGAYVILEKDIQKGRSIALTRVKDWWAKDRRYTKYRFNPDKINYRLIRDSNTAIEYFKKGRLDYTTLNNPKNWYEKTEFDGVYDGYVEKATYYADYPVVPRGIYINCSRPLLNDVNVRVGLQHASNFEKVIDFDYRGDASRIQTFSDGYGRYTNNKIKAREYSVSKALDSFSKSGFSKRDTGGVLTNGKGERLSFTLTYPSSPLLFSTILSRIKEDAIKAGVELKLEPLDGSAMFTKGLEKKHELIFSGWGVGPPFPTYHQFYHSSNAFEEGSKEPKAMTNNFSVYADSEMDTLALAVRDATSLDVIEKSAHRAEEIIHRDAPWIPGYKVPLLRCAYWRWMHWPDDFNVKQTGDLLENHVHWIDEGIQKDTLKAMREGRTFPEKNLVFDQYRKN